MFYVIHVVVTDATVIYTCRII